ncbi:MAG: phospholipase D-like domain-containing protein [Halapricum sp.]
MRRIAGVVVLLAIVLPPTAAAVGPARSTSTASAPTDGNASIAAVYPNPIAPGDAGEYVVLSVPPDTDLGDYRFGDDEGVTPLPNRTASGRVVLTSNRSQVPGSVSGPVVECPSCPALANAGERLTLDGPAGRLDAVEYSDAPEGDVLRPGEDRRWRPLGATAFDPIVGESGTARVFTLPDSPEEPVDLLRGADRRIMLAGYTLTSERVTDALVAAHDRGVAVDVLVDGGPVGGLTNRSAAALDRLRAANVSVRLIGGHAARYRFHHAKYAVVDDRAVVMTENWKPAGVGGASSRGWGTVVGSPAVVDGLARMFRADFGGRDAIPWGRFRENATFEDIPPTHGRYPDRLAPETLPVDRVELIAAPDNAAGRVGGLLANATDSIDIIQVSIGGRDDVLLGNAIDAARRGVDVEILLSNAWYVRDENHRLAVQLRALAERENLPVRVRLADPGGRYEKIHAKGVVIDGDTAVVGSLNWNANAYHNNREVALVLHGEQVGAYFERAFERDWRGGVTTVPVGLLVVAIVAIGLAGAIACRIDFEV